MSSQSLAEQCARHQADQISLPYSSTALAPPSFPSRPGSSILMDFRLDSFESSSTAEYHASRWTGKKSTERWQRRVINDMLPDDILLEIIYFYMIGYRQTQGYRYWGNRMAKWLTLVHVCQRWRHVVFGSPRRLDLRLVCSTRTPTDTLDVWPALPLVIQDSNCQNQGLIALLKRSELVCRITEIELFNVHLEDISKAMEVPFPELTHLKLLHSDDETGSVIPVSDSFLGGYAPRLQLFCLRRVPFPGLPKLLSSATHLADLQLVNIPHSGYFSPEAMVACLSLLTSLGVLTLEFESPQSHPDWKSSRPSPSTRTVLPTLTDFSFKGDSEYLEGLVARVDAPRLKRMYITFFNDIVFVMPQFTRLISNTATLNAFNKAKVFLGDTRASIKLLSKASDNRGLEVTISCKEFHWQVSFLEKVCTSSLSRLSTLVDLYIEDRSYLQQVWGDNIGDAPWLELLRSFNTIKNLFLSENIAPHVVSALQELVGGRTMEVLPTLRNVFIKGLQPSGPVQEGVGEFVAGRQVTSHPVVVSRWY